MNRYFAAVLIALSFIATPAWAESDDLYEMEDWEVYLIQSTLYNLNYKLDPDGKLGPQTRRAISNWQSNTDRPVTGFLTEAQFDHLFTLDTSSGVWGSTAASTDGTSYWAWNQPSRSESENVAMSGCKKNSNEPDDCIVMSGVSFNSEEDWMVAVWCQREGSSTTYNHIGLHRAPTLSKALDNAYDSAREKGYASSQCSLRSKVEVRGRHD